MEEEKREKELKNHTIALMVGTALFFDALQWLLAFVFMDWLAGFFAFMTFFVWFKIHGVKFAKPKRALALGGAGLIEIIPVLSVLPAWTLAVLLIALDTKDKKVLKKMPGGDAIASAGEKAGIIK
jgi:hypothetical protein